MKKEKAAPKARKPYIKKSDKPKMSTSEYATTFTRLAELYAQIDMLEKQVERLADLKVQAEDLRKSLIK